LGRHDDLIEGSGVMAQQRVDIRTTRGLALAVPIRSDDRVVIVGDGLRHLAVSLANTGADPELVSTEVEANMPARIKTRQVPPGERLSLARDSYDHAILVGHPDRWPPASRSEVGRAVAPGGYVLIALAVAERRRGLRRSLAPTRAALQDAGVEVTAEYGIRQSITDVRHLVPLRGPALRWYLRDAFLPWSRAVARFSRIAATVMPTPLLGRAFPAIAVVGRRSRDDGVMGSC
jgi:SAM-dependent methyltransferase